MSRTNAMQCAMLEEDPIYKSKKEWLGSEFFGGSAVAHMMNEKGVLSKLETPPHVAGAKRPLASTPQCRLPRGVVMHGALEAASDFLHRISRADRVIFQPLMAQKESFLRYPGGRAHPNAYRTGQCSARATAWANKRTPRHVINLQSLTCACFW